MSLSPDDFAAYALEGSAVKRKIPHLIWTIFTIYDKSQIETLQNLITTICFFTSRDDLCFQIVPCISVLMVLINITENFNQQNHIRAKFIQIYDFLPQDTFHQKKDMRVPLKLLMR